MSGLSDLEELLHRIFNKDITDYMREGAACYYASAYRGCITLSYIALFDDLAQKLHELAKTNAKAKKISVEVKKRQSDQQVFETYMVDQLKAEKLITEAQASTLEQIRVLRNKAAHPSGVHPSPEAARFVFFEVIDKFLSQRMLLTTQAVDAIMMRLENANFFPSTSITEMSSIVALEIEELHESALPILIERLTSGCSDTNQTYALNCQRFLFGLSHRSNDSGAATSIIPQLRRRLVKGKADDLKYARTIVSVASANPRVIEDLDSPTRGRLQALVNSVTQDTKPTVAITQLAHPAYFLVKMIAELGETKTIDILGTVTNTIVNKYLYTSTLIAALQEAPLLRGIWFAKILEEAGSSTFEIANRFASTIPDIDAEVGKVITEEEAFSLIFAISQAAEWNAYSAKDLRSGNFTSIPAIKELAIRFTSTSPDKAQELYDAKSASFGNFEAFKERHLGLKVETSEVAKP